MLRIVIATLLLVVTASAANVRLYLTDGNYHLVREYKVLEDRVRFYSVERSEWEEIPLKLVDLKRTETEIRERQAALEEETKVLTAEDKAEREIREEAAKVPLETGAYLVVDDEIKPLEQAESEVVTKKRRSILKVLSPVPIVSGKATVEIEGKHSATLITTDRPEFYIRLATEERFGILRLKPKKDARMVEKWTIEPVTKQIYEEREEVPTFRLQMGEALYHVWPMERLEPGEYAVVEYTEGKGNIQVWDFSYRPSGNPGP
jgi:hypothetical protein